MNTRSTKYAIFGAAIIAASLFTTPATAGGPAHRLPADTGRTYPTYELRVVTMPAAGHMLTVQLVNKDTGQLVTNADVSMQHLVWLGYKAVPQSQMVLVALEPDGKGDYVCAREHVRRGERVVFRAHVTGEPSGTWTTLALNT